MHNMQIEFLKAQIDIVRDLYEAQLRMGQSESWTCDQRTRDLWCLSHFINDRFSNLDSEYRKDLGWMFNRIVRSVEDPFEAACVVIHVGDNGLNTEDYSKDYWTAKNHKRWG